MLARSAPDEDHFLHERYAKARNRYKPRHINILLIAEGPPCALDRHFYFEDVKRQDSLFLEIMGILYPREKQRYLNSRRPAELKADLLEQFKEDGYFLLELSEIPTSLFRESEEVCLPGLMERVSKTIDKSTPVILIKSNVYDICFEALQRDGYNVMNEKLPFPGSGQQKVFREKFARLISSL